MKYPAFTQHRPCCICGKDLYGAVGQTWTILIKSRSFTHVECWKQALYLRWQRLVTINASVKEIHEAWQEYSRYADTN